MGVFPLLANKVYIPLYEGSPRRAGDFSVKKLHASRHEPKSIPQHVHYRASALA